MRSFIRFIAVAFVCLFAISGRSQTTVVPYLNSTIQLLDNNGIVCSGCLLDTFQSGTTTPLVTYSESTGTSLNSNPIVLNSAGRATVYLTTSSYKFRLRTAAGVTLWTQDGISPSTPLSTFAGLIDTGDLTLQQTTAATSGANQSSNNIKVLGRYWTGSADATETCNLQDVLGTGSNPTVAFTLTCSGSSGATTFSVVPNTSFTGNVSVGGTQVVTGISTINQISLTSRDCRADGTIDLTGAVDASAIINTCIANAKTNKQTHVLLPCGNILLTAVTINGTNFPGIHISGCGFEADATLPPTQSQGITNIWCNQGITKACLDLTGSGSAEVDHLVFTLFKAGLTGAGMGIIQSRDNAGGGGSANPLCFTEAYNIHDIYITDNGGTSPTLNSNRGFVGIYNVSAENGLYSNVHMLADTPFVFSQTNVLGTVSSYQTILTGCPPSMTGVTLVNPVLTGSATTLPLIEANITNGFSLLGYQCVGGNACIKFENTAGATATSGWTVTGITEQSTSDILASSVNMANMHFMMLIASPPPGFVFKPLAGNLTFDQCDFLIDDYFSLVPFIDNVQTGTQIRGSKIHIGFATSASNTTLLDSEVFAPTLTDANIAFNAASSYLKLTSTGISTVGSHRFASGTLAAPGMAFSSSASTGWFFNSNSIVQLSYGNTAGPEYTASGDFFGSGMVHSWTSSVDPNNAAADTGLSRDAAGTVDVGNGTAANTSGRIKVAAVVAGGTAATLTGTGACATFSTQTGGSMAGRATCTAGTAASTLTITPGTTAPNGWVCSAYDQTTRANLLQQTATVAASCTLTATSVTQNDVIVFTAIAF